MDDPAGSRRQCIYQARSMTKTKLFEGSLKIAKPKHVAHRVLHARVEQIRKKVELQVWFLAILVYVCIVFILDLTHTG